MYESNSSAAQHPGSSFSPLQLTLLSQLQRPHSGRHTRQGTGNHLRDFQPMLERPKGTPRTTTASSVYLRRIRARAEQVDHFGVRDRVH